MKRFLFSLLLLVVCSFFMLPSPVFSQEILPEIVAPSKTVLQWLGDHWESVALIVSEVAAVISVKYSGIIKSFLTILGSLFK